MDANADGRPRNRVEAVHNALESPMEDNADEKEEGKDRAEEEKDEYDEDDDDDDQQEEEEEGEEGRGNAVGAHEDRSNQAGERHEEEGAGVLPPRDGSLKFGGPQNERQSAVVEAFKHAWGGYKKYAWGHDHLRPISKSGQVRIDFMVPIFISAKC